ncbi:hypothetical protein [Leucobacter luti]|uniref:hypothetical protein n=1 Tax=Leucobacter luti TaxID=340320 RepID=UPI0010618085|nr:hypothetical protein [Leucobacter luti]
MSNNVRRQDQGLGRTAAGGSGGSFAAHERDTADVPPRATGILTVDGHLVQLHETASRDGVDSAQHLQAINDTLIAGTGGLFPDEEVSAVTLDYAPEDSSQLVFYSVRDEFGNEMQITNNDEQEMRALVNHMNFTETSASVETEDPDGEMIFVVPLSRS